MAKDIKLDDNRITNDIAGTVLEIPGVSRFSSSIAENLTKVVLGKKQNAVGVALNRDDNDIFTVSLHVIVVFGVNIPQVSYEIQTAVKEMLEKNYKIKAKAINIYVEGVDAAKGTL